MPYFNDPNLDPNQQQNQQNNGSSVSISGASPTVNSNASGQPQGSSQPGGNQGLNTGSGFTSLDKYLQTNNSQDFGNKVLGKVSDQVNNAQTQMSDAANSFTNKVQNSNTLPSMDQVNSSIANPTSADPKQFQSWEKETYSGPKSLGESQDDWNKYWSGAKQAQTNTQLLGNDAGRFTLLNQYFGRPSYNYGEQSLDNALFQQSGLGSQTQALQNQAIQLQTTGNQKAQDLQNLASQQAGAVEQNRNQILSAIGLDAQGNVIQGANAGAIGKQYADVQSQVDKANSDRVAQDQAVKVALQNNTLSSDQMAALGLAPGTNVYNVDMGQFLDQGADLNKDQVMTPEQRSRIQALSQLAGVNDTFASGLASNPTAAYSYRNGDLQNAINGAKTSYDTEMQNNKVSIPAIWTAQGAPISLSDLRQRVAQTEARQNSSAPNDAERRSNASFLNDVKPILAQAESDISNKYQSNRVLPQAAAMKPGHGPETYGRLPAS